MHYYGLTEVVFAKKAVERSIVWCISVWKYTVVLHQLM